MIISAEDLEPLPVNNEEHLIGALQFAFSDGECSFAILSESDEKYIQTAVSDDGFEIEQRDGDSTTHCGAVRAFDHSDKFFTWHEMRDAMLAYYRRDAAPAWLVWKKLNV